ncbi:MAG: metallophosphoesterase [Gemmatimonadetes bacterium]|nr:metallophosphoesterase [Gemmatimonadota bacterium]
MTGIRWATDLHLDHAAPGVIESFCLALRRGPAVPVILTGDLSTAPRLVQDLVDLADAAAAPLYFVLGNHDHYHGSVGGVRDAVIALGETHPAIRWLPPAGVVPLDPDTALVGVDGWADGRAGNALTTPLVLNDDRLIAEVAAQPDRISKLAVKRVLADADATRLATLLERAAPGYRRIVVATHVPPFVEGLPAGGRLSRPEWHPLLVSGATGAVLRRFAMAHPDHQLTVLAGHTHAAREATILPNLSLRVAAARYGDPRVAAITL